MEQVGPLRGNLGGPPRLRQRPEPRDSALGRDPVRARPLEVVLSVPELAQPLEIDLVFEAARGVLQREVADLAVDSRLVERDRTRP